MGFRSKYIKLTRLKLSSDIHIHHIDRNRKNNDLSNLIHIDRLRHIRYHRLINMINEILWYIDNNNHTIEELEKDYWLKRSIICYVPMKNWCKKLLSIEKQLLNNVLIRNKKLNINTLNVFITERQRRIVNIYHELNN